MLIIKNQILLMLDILKDFKRILIFVLCCLCCSCASLETQKLTSRNVASAYKYRQESNGMISREMSKAEVVFSWGQPNRIYKPDVKNEYNHYSDEFWIYTTGKTPGIGKSDISYEVYFQNEKVSEIVEHFWEGRFLAS